VTGTRGIFISYRRDQTAAQAGRLYDWLVTRFGDDHVFMDVDSIRLGVDFVQVIEDAVSSCDVLLALIGAEWSESRDDRGDRRLDDPDDFVRLEIETALRRQIPVVPILLNGAPLPRRDDLPPPMQSLVRRQACVLSDATFRTDVARLVDQLGDLLGAEPPPVSRAPARTDAPPSRDIRATVIKRSPTRCVLDVQLAEERHVVTFRVSFIDSVEVDGVVVARERLSGRYEFTLSDGPVALPSVLEVKTSRAGLKVDQVTLQVAGAIVYQG
jgi:hypothetical protein